MWIFPMIYWWAFHISMPLCARLWGYTLPRPFWPGSERWPKSIIILSADRHTGRDRPQRCLWRSQSSLSQAPWSPLSLSQRTLPFWSRLYPQTAIRMYGVTTHTCGDLNDGSPVNWRARSQRTCQSLRCSRIGRKELNILVYMGQCESLSYSWLWRFTIVIGWRSLEEVGPACKSPSRFLGIYSDYTRAFKFAEMEISKCPNQSRKRLIRASYRTSCVYSPVNHAFLPPVLARREWQPEGNILEVQRYTSSYRAPPWGWRCHSSGTFGRETRLERRFYLIWVPRILISHIYSVLETIGRIHPTYSIWTRACYVPFKFEHVHDETSFIGLAVRSSRVTNPAVLMVL